ncbi:hypothetical protein [Flavobacterium sp.]
MNLCIAILGQDIKTTKKAGHYGDSSTYEKHLNEKAEFYSFLLYHLNQ